MNNYTVLHLHTEQSLLDSVTNYKDYIDKSVMLGQTAIAFTEHGNINCWVEKKLYCDKNNIKYIHGMECYLTESFENIVRDNYHTILLAKNYDGVKELNVLRDLSSHKDHFYYKPRLSFNEFFNISDNIIKISACLASPLNKCRDRGIYNDLCRAYDYYEIQPHINSEEQKEYNQYLVALSKKYNKPLSVGTDTHSLNLYKAECRKIILRAKKIEFTNEDDFDLTYKSYDEIVEMFKLQGVISNDVVIEALENTNVIANSIDNFELDQSFKYPYITDDDEKELKNTIVAKYKHKIENHIIDNNPKYKENIIEEFRVFKKINMVGFILFMSQLMTWCRDNNIRSGFSRGSVAGSTIAYITDITDVDPIIWGTVFSRFANEDRVEIGDIDQDFETEQRDLVYNYIIDRFGKDYTSFILTNGTLAGKSVIDEVGRALKIPLNEVSEIKKEYEEDFDSTKKKYPEIFYYYDGLVGTVISQGFHPAGIIASPVNLVENYGTFYSNNKRIISINMEECHDISLVKYDILGLQNIKIIDDTCKLAKIKYPLSNEINWNDKNVWDNIIKSNIGIFQFESSFAYDMMKKFKPRSVVELAMINAAIRPSGSSYRDKMMSREKNVNPSKEIDELLSDTLGYLTFQEQTLSFLQQICGLSGSEADNVRRAIGRKQVDRLTEALPKILDGYCNQSNKPREESEEEVKKFLQVIEDSSSYQFGFNHSIGYSMISYLCAYLRYYHPIEFLCAYFNNIKNDEDLINGNKLARVLGIIINKPILGKSTGNYFIDKQNNSLYKGISSIKSFSLKSSKSFYILGQKKYNNFYELLLETEKYPDIQTNHINILISIGYFSEFGSITGLQKFYKCYINIHGKKQFNIEGDKYPVKIDILKNFCNSKTEKLYKDFDEKRFFNFLLEKLYALKDNLYDIIYYENKYLGQIYTKDDNSSSNLCYIKDLIIKKTIIANLYYIKTGQTKIVKIRSKNYDENYFEKDGIIKVYEIVQEPRYIYKGVDKNGKNIFEKDYSNMEDILKDYFVIIDKREGNHENE